MAEHNFMKAMAKITTMRTHAREEVTAAITELCVQLVELMKDAGASVLRGLPNLSHAVAPYRGVVVRAKHRDKTLLPLPERSSDGWGGETLVFTEKGTLMIARRNNRGEVNERSVGDTDLVAEDIVPVMESIDLALTRHLDAVDRGVTRYQAMQQLAAKLRTVLQEAP